ncbi:hypothetical protein Tco_0432737 [Tanacetum coccineum]
MERGSLSYGIAVRYFLKSDQGVDPETVIVPLATHLRPMLLNVWNERRKAAFTDNTQKNQTCFSLIIEEKKLDEDKKSMLSSLNMQLYEKVKICFDDNPSTSDMLIMLKNGIDVQDVNDAESVFNYAVRDRIALPDHFTRALAYIDEVVACFGGALAFVCVTLAARHDVV